MGMDERRQSFQTIAWFNDLHKRELLDLDPPYQRRSVWNLEYQQFFVETLLLDYPAPAIFIHEVITPTGNASYSVVDGKQRLTTVFQFVEDLFPVDPESDLTEMAGKFFSDLPDSMKKSFWSYQFSVEYLPTTEESTLKSVFDRINRNVAKLTRQELRHARFSGLFAKSAERMTEYLEKELPQGVPNIASNSRRQMKDVEFTAQLLLLCENGPETFSQDILDAAYSERDTDWSDEAHVERRFKRVIDALSALFNFDPMTTPPNRRMRNQVDFYSLFGAYLHIIDSKDSVPDPGDVIPRLAAFIEIVADEEAREENAAARDYYTAARVSTTDLGRRRTRISRIKGIISGD